MFVWGDGSYGETGASGSLNRNFLGRGVDIDEPVVQLSAGARHALCLGASGKVYAFGDDTHGQCGIKQRQKTGLWGDRVLVPRSVQLDQGRNALTSGALFMPRLACCGDTH